MEEIENAFNQWLESPHVLSPATPFLAKKQAFYAGYRSVKPDPEKEERFMCVTMDSCIPTDQIRFIYNGREVGRITDIGTEK
jgi:hypothetical protein